MNLSRHILQNGNELVNLTTKVSLPLVSTEEVLRQNYFMAGQEQAAIEHALFGNPVSMTQRINFKIIPTWQCNLRCTHCFVLHKLKSNGLSDIDPMQVVGLIRRAKTKSPNLSAIGVSFIGGEPTLNPELCLDVIAVMREQITDLDLHFTMTSNCVKLDKTILKLYKNLDSFTISIDGPKEYHDKQRIPLKAYGVEDSVHDSSVRNIARLMKCGMADKIRTQASLSNVGWTPGNIRQYIKDMLSVGVPFHAIHFGAIVPTRQSQKASRFVEIARRKVFPYPCCKYRMGYDFVVDDGNIVYCDYFEDVEYSKIGVLTDSLEVLERNMKDVIKSQMPVLNDQKCLDCKSIGACWGWCCNATNIIKNPSAYCDQDWLNATMEKAAADGRLLGYLSDPANSLAEDYLLSGSI